MKKSALFIQIISTISLDFLATQTGFVFAWPSYTLENFKSNSTVLSTPMTPLEVSLLGSLTNIGGLVSTPFVGYVFNKIGRKYASVLFGLPFVISWSIIYMSKSVTFVLIAMTIAGIGAGGQIGSCIFISELSDDSIRGGLTASTTTGYFIGILLSYCFGSWLTYHQVVLAHLTLSVICVLLMTLLKESPVFLVMVGKEKEAAKSISFYKQIDVKSDKVQDAISRIKLQLDPRFELMLQNESDFNVARELLKTTKTSFDNRSESSWIFLKNSNSTQQALKTTITIVTASILMGSLVVQVYAEKLFKEAVPSLSTSMCSILSAVVFLFASILCFLAVDKFGRKFLLISTSAGAGVCTMLLGLQLQHSWASHKATATLIYLYCFIYTMGVATVPFIISAEVFLPEVRALCNSLVLVSTWSMNFLMLLTYNLLVDYLGLDIVFYFFSVVCFFGASYSYFCVPETKGLPADAIQKLFMKNKQIC